MSQTQERIRELFTYDPDTGYFFWRGCKAIRKDNSSGFKGVSWSKCSQAWCARIQKNGRGIQIGVFATPEAAHEAYAREAVATFGAFARTN